MGGPQVNKPPAMPGSIPLTPEHRAGQGSPGEGLPAFWKSRSPASRSPVLHSSFHWTLQLRKLLLIVQGPAQMLPPLGKLLCLLRAELISLQWVPAFILLVMG